VLTGLRRWPLSNSRFSWSLASSFWDEVIRLRGHGEFVLQRRDPALICSNQPPKATDRQHKVRVILRNGCVLRSVTEFTQRFFGIQRCASSSACQRGQQTAFVNIFNVPGSPASARPRGVLSSTTPTTRRTGARRQRLGCARFRNGEPGLSFVSEEVITSQRSTATPTRAGAEKEVGGATLFVSATSGFNNPRTDACAGVRGMRVKPTRLGDTFR